MCILIYLYYTSYIHSIAHEWNVLFESLHKTFLEIQRTNQRQIQKQMHNRIYLSMKQGLYTVIYHNSFKF